MKWSFLLFSSFLCLQAIAQYPATGNKMRLGWQTTGDGLVYRGAIGDTATLDPSGLNNAWMLLDTANGNLYAYRAKAWRLVSGGGGSVSDTLTGEVKGPLDSTYIDTVANIIFTTTTDTTVGVGELEYNDTQGSLIQGLKGGNVANVIGQQIHQRVTNATGAPLTKGTAVFLYGSQGNRITVRKALATADSTSANTFGIVAESIADNQSGYVITEGLITNMNTNALTEGAAVYLSPTVAGELTTTKPQAPQHTVYIGVCVKQNAGSGELFVKIRNGQELDELHDVLITFPASNASLYYNAAQGVWRDTTGAVLASDTAVFARDFQISGTTNYIPKFTGANTIGNSGFIENGQEVYLGGTTNAFNFSRFSIYFNPVNNGFPVVADTRAYNSAQPVRGGWAFAGKYDSIGNYTAFGQIAAYKENTSNQQKNGFLQFSTISNADAYPEERMRITSAGNVGIATSSPSRPLHVNANSSMIIPSGATGTRPASGADGDIRFNSTVGIKNLEWYNGTAWREPVNAARSPAAGLANSFSKFDASGLLDTSAILIQANNRIGIFNSPAAGDSALTVTGGIRATTGVRATRFNVNTFSTQVVSINNFAPTGADGGNLFIGNGGASLTLGGGASSNASSNLGIGFGALQSNTTASLNLAVGGDALIYTTTGSENIAIGQAAGAFLTTGTGNTYIGRSAGLRDSTSSYNIGIGAYALQLIGTGGAANENIAIGNSAGENLRAGSYNNVMIGASAAKTTAASAAVTSLNSSVYIGNYTTPSATTGVSNEIAIGYQTAGNGSNTTTIGNSSTTNTVIPAGSLTVDVIRRKAPVTVTGNHTVAASTSWLICNGTGAITLTLPAASSWTGREIMVKTIQPQAVNSASSNVVPIDGTATGTAILPATDGAWCTLVSDGTNWIIMQRGN